ncbi:MAG: hypothetical protein HYR60_03635 [Acidobacteria bacterium]|nr:hypothetical protein [Acidobacteriota bacterium]
MALAQPAVNSGGVRNAASARYGLPNPGVAPRAWFVIQGQNLGPADPVRSDTPTNSIGGTSVQIFSGGQQWDLPLLVVSAGEILGELPADVPVGEASLTIMAASGTTTDAAKVNVVASSFGVFTANLSNEGAAVLEQLRLGSTFNLSELQNPAKAGDEINLWGTGLGSSDAAVEVSLDDKSAEIVAKSAGENGIDLIRIRVPAAVTGCGLPVAVKSGEIRNLVGLLSVAAEGGVCLDRNGFSAEDFEKARTSGGLKAAYLFLLRFGVPGAGSFDIGFANFSRVIYDLMRTFRSNWAQTVPGACYAATYDSKGGFSTQGQPGADFFDDFYPFGETPLEAGPVIDVRGPGGPQQMQRVDKGSYSGFFLNLMNPLVSYFSPGDYTLSGSGGEVGSFSGNVRIGPPVTWQDVPPMQDVPRNKDLKLTWTGGNPGDRVWVVGYSVETNGTDFARVGVVSCYELAKKGTMTIPASALGFLPVSSQLGGGALLLYSMAAPQRFQPSGGGLDAGYLLSLSYSVAVANFQ